MNCRDYIPHEVKEALVRLGGMLPMNIFLRQEIDRMQKILTLVRRTLSDLKMALEGTIIMSDDLKEVLDNMYDARYGGTGVFFKLKGLSHEI